ncbi:MAG TPA: phosphate-starvation-inducible PsiE family protein [Methanocorpusculum sp.]|nr:phosphate-starvation-inducible PsiE family protein [Methanocorpusculum sp.]
MSLLFNYLQKLRKALSYGCGFVAISIYITIAVLLVIAAVLGFVESFNLMIEAFKSPDHQTISDLLQAILLIIVIATLVDMVASYAHSGKVLIRPILIAGITTMIRRLLVTDLQLTEVIGIVIVILGLTVTLIFTNRHENEDTSDNTLNNS